LTFIEIKKLMDRQSAQQRKGKLTDPEIKGLVKEGGQRENSTRR
jgi:hypothetical protein